MDNQYYDMGFSRYPGFEANEYAAAITWNKDDVLITGGKEALEKNRESFTVYQLKTLTGNITKLSYLNIARQKHAMVVVKNHPIVIGGYNSGREYIYTSNCLKSSEAYIAKEQKWKEIRHQLTEGRADFSACV